MEELARVYPRGVLLSVPGGAVWFPPWAHHYIDCTNVIDVYWSSSSSLGVDVLPLGALHFSAVTAAATGDW